MSSSSLKQLGFPYSSIKAVCKEVGYSAQSFIVFGVDSQDDSYSPKCLYLKETGESPLITIMFKTIQCDKLKQTILPYVSVSGRSIPFSTIDEMKNIITSHKEKNITLKKIDVQSSLSLIKTSPKTIEYYSKESYIQSIHDSSKIKTGDKLDKSNSLDGTTWWNSVSISPENVPVCQMCFEDTEKYKESVLLVSKGGAGKMSGKSLSQFEQKHLGCSKNCLWFKYFSDQRTLLKK